MENKRKMARKCYFNTFLITLITTVRQTTAGTSKTAISALEKCPSGEKRQKFIQAPCERKFATENFNRQFLSIRNFLAPVCRRLGPHSRIPPRRPTRPITGDGFYLSLKGTLILEARGMFRAQARTTSKARSTWPEEGKNKNFSLKIHLLSLKENAELL